MHPLSRLFARARKQKKPVRPEELLNRWSITQGPREQRERDDAWAVELAEKDAAEREQRG